MRATLVTTLLLMFSAQIVMAAPADAIRASLAKLNLPMQVQSISESPLAGLFQVQMDSGRIIYASEDVQRVKARGPWSRSGVRKIRARQ